MKNEVFVGLDLHYRSIYMVARFNQNILIEKKFQVKGKLSETVDEMDAELKQSVHEKTKISSAHESGTAARTLKNLLEQKGWCSIIVAGNRIPKTDFHRSHKSDRKDAQNISLQLEKGLLEPVIDPGEVVLQLRRQLKVRRDLVDQRSRLLVKIKANLRDSGISTTNRVKVDDIHELDQLIGNQQGAAEYVRSLWKQKTNLDRRIKYIESKLTVFREYPSFEFFLDNLQTIDGVSWLTALELISCLGDMNRFPTKEQFISFCGLIPNQHQSGGMDYRNFRPSQKHEVRVTFWRTTTNLIRCNSLYKEEYNRLKAEGKNHIQRRLSVKFAKQIYPLWQA